MSDVFDAAWIPKIAFGQTTIDRCDDTEQKHSKRQQHHPDQTLSLFDTDKTSDNNTGQDNQSRNNCFCFRFLIVIKIHFIILNNLNTLQPFPHTQNIMMFPRLSLLALLALASFQDNNNNYAEAFSTSPKIRSSYISTASSTNGRQSSSSLRMSSTDDEVAKLRAAAAKAREEAAKLSKVRQ